MTSTQHVRVEGSSYQRGCQYGRQAATRVRLSVQAYQQIFAHFADWDWPTVRREAARFEAPIGSVMPAYLEELRGIADGAGLDLADVLAINVRTEVMYAAKARQAPRSGTQPQAPPECSAFACVPAPGQNDPVLIGQNWDWLLHSAQTLVVLEVRQDEGPDFVTVVEAGLLAKTGMNAAGLGLVTNALVTDADVGEPGLPYHVLLRAVLDCTTITDALEVLQAGVQRFGLDRAADADHRDPVPFLEGAGAGQRDQLARRAPSHRAMSSCSKGTWQGLPAASQMRRAVRSISTEAMVAPCSHG